MLTPEDEGTPCGDDDYYWSLCNEGPGTCRIVDSRFGSFGVCHGTPIVGASCDDFNECTVNDTCKLVITDDGAEIGVCMGDFAGEVPCNDYDYSCTKNDRCVVLFIVVLLLLLNKSIRDCIPVLNKCTYSQALNKQSSTSRTGFTALDTEIRCG